MTSINKPVLFSNIIWVILYYLFTTALFIIGSTLLVALLDVFAGRGKSGLLNYTVYFVAAIFNSLFYCSLCFDKLNNLTNKLIQNIVIIICSMLVSLLLIKIFYHYDQMRLPQYKGDLNYTVPGHEYVTWMYLIVLILSASFFCYANITPRKRKK